MSGLCCFIPKLTSSPLSPSPILPEPQPQSPPVLPPSSSCDRPSGSASFSGVTGPGRPHKQQLFVFPILSSRRSPQ